MGGILAKLSDDTLTCSAAPACSCSSSNSSASSSSESVMLSITCTGHDASDPAADGLSSDETGRDVVLTPQDDF